VRARPSFASRSCCSARTSASSARCTSTFVVVPADSRAWAFCSVARATSMLDRRAASSSSVIEAA
jgi:hypothetical protein